MKTLPELESLVRSIIQLHEKRDFTSVSTHISESELKEDTWFTEKRFHEVCDAIEKEIGKFISLEHIDTLKRHQVQYRGNMNQAKHPVEERKRNEWLGDDLQHRQHRLDRKAHQPPRGTRDKKWRSNQPKDEMFRHVEHEQAVLTDIVDGPGRYDI